MHKLQIKPRELKIISVIAATHSIGDAAALAYMAAPAAYGIELYVNAGLDKPLGAGFLLLDDAAHARLRPHMPLTLLEKTPSGGLYRNDVAFGFAKPGEARP